MATDFNKNNTTISTTGGFKPDTRNTPLDARTVVELKADIDTIPNPFVGMHIVVKADETNDNKMTEYVVKSLKANSLGIADSKVNEIVLAKDFLGVSGNGNGISEEQAQQLNTAYTHSQTAHVQTSDIPTKTSDLTNDANYASETYVTNKIAEAQLGGDSGTVDLSRLGADLSLTGSTLKLKNTDGNEIGTGVVLPEGFSGDYNDLTNIPTNLATKDEILTAVSVNGYTFTPINGVITLPNYSSETGGTVVKEDNIHDFYSSSKEGKNILLIGDSTTAANAINTRIAKYQEEGNYLYNCTVTNTSAIGRTLSAWMNNHMESIISSSDTVDLYVFCLGINDLMNDNKTEDELSTMFKTAIDSLLSRTNAYILLRIPFINPSKYEWQQILRKIYMSYKGYNPRLDVIDIPLLTINDTLVNPFIADTVHPTELGYYAIVDELVNRICNLDLDNRNNTKQDILKGYIKNIDSGENSIEVFSINNEAIFNGNEVLYIGNMPYAYKYVEKTDFNTYKIYMSESYNNYFGIVKFISEVNGLYTSYKYNPNDWYLLDSTATTKGLWYVYDVSDLTLSTNPDLTANFSCITKNSDFGRIRLTAVYSSEINISAGVWGNSPTYNFSKNATQYVNSASITSSILSSKALTGDEKYVFICLDVLDVKGELNCKIGNVSFSIDGVNISPDKFIQFYNCGTPSVTGSPILMTQESVLELLVKLNLIDSSYLPKDPVINTYGNISVSVAQLNVSEGGSDTFKVVLDKAPTNNQTVNISSNNTDVTVSPTSITFTPSNYNTAQTITVSVAEDEDTINDSAIITLSSANVNNKTISITVGDNDVEVTDPVAVQGITLNKETLDVKVGQSIQLNYTITPDNATNKNVTWSVDNSNITVTDGLIKGVTEGTSVVTVTTEDGNHTDTCTVTISAADTTGVVSDGLIIHLDASDISGTTWSDRANSLGDLTLTMNEGSSLTGDTLIIGANASIEANAGIALSKECGLGISSMSEITYEINYRCDPERTISNVNTTLLRFPGNISITEKTNTADTIYFENFATYKVGNIKTNDYEGGWRQIICVFNVTTGNSVVYLNGTKVFDLTGNINAGNFASERFEIKAAKGFNLEIGSIRIYNKLLSSDEITQNLEYENSLNR